MTTAEDIYYTLEQMGDERQARNLSRFSRPAKAITARATNSWD